MRTPVDEKPGKQVHCGHPDLSTHTPWPEQESTNSSELLAHAWSVTHVFPTRWVPGEHASPCAAKDSRTEQPISSSRHIRMRHCDNILGQDAMLICAVALLEHAAIPKKFWPVGCCGAAGWELNCLMFPRRNGIHQPWRADGAH